MKIIIILFSLLLSACSSSPNTSSFTMTLEERNEAIYYHKALAEKARKKGHAIAQAPAEPNSQAEMNRAYDEAKKHTLRATALQKGNGFFGPILDFFLTVIK